MKTKVGFTKRIPVGAFGWGIAQALCKVGGSRYRLRRTIFKMTGK